jgi:hypothetical protein
MTYLYLMVESLQGIRPVTAPEFSVDLIWDYVGRLCQLMRTKVEWD